MLVGGIGDDSYYMAINYIDILGLSVFTNNVNLPMVLNSGAQSQEISNPVNNNPYPLPIGEDGTNGYPSILQQNAYPNPYP